MDICENTVLLTLPGWKTKAMYRSGEYGYAYVKGIQSKGVAAMGKMPFFRRETGSGHRH
jgi:hypothetical protein